MKDSTKKIVNEQLKLIIKEIEDLNDLQQRIKERKDLIKLLVDVSDQLNS